MQKVLIVLAIVFVVIVVIGAIFVRFLGYNYGIVVPGLTDRNNIAPIKISGSAMSPNYTDGQLWLVDKIIYTTTNPQRGDVVLFKDIPDPNWVFAKRIIGLPGEGIEIKNGNVYINGQVINESYVLKDTMTDSRDYPLPNQKIVPQDSYFVLGDNRAGSEDSRNYGFVPKENIIGKLTTCYNNCTK